MFVFEAPATPASILLQVPALRNCCGFYSYDVSPFLLPMDFILYDRIPLVPDLAREDLAWPVQQQVMVQIPGRDDCYFPFILDCWWTPAEALWPIGVALSGCGLRTTWWERGSVWGHRLHDHIPLALQFVGEGSCLHWNLAVETRVERRREGDAWLPFDMHDGTGDDCQVRERPCELSGLQRANLGQSSPSRSPAPRASSSVSASSAMGAREGVGDPPLW